MLLTYFLIIFLQKIWVILNNLIFTNCIQVIRVKIMNQLLFYINIMEKSRYLFPYKFFNLISFLPLFLICADHFNIKLVEVFTVLVIRVIVIVVIPILVLQVLIAVVVVHIVILHFLFATPSIVLVVVFDEWITKNSIFLGNFHEEFLLSSFKFNSSLLGSLHVVPPSFRVVLHHFL